MKIWYRNRWCKINQNKPPHDTRQLRSFLLYNNARDCFVKCQGGWYKLCKTKKLLFVSRTLYLLSLKEWLEIALNDNFQANI